MSENYEKRSEFMAEYSLDEAASLLRQVAGNRRADESVKAVLRRVKRKLRNWSDSRVKAIWYQDRRVRVRAEEVAELRSITKQTVETKAATDELQELRARISRLEEYFRATDEAFHSPARDAMRAQLGKVG